MSSGSGSRMYSVVRRCKRRGRGVWVGVEECSEARADPRLVFISNSQPASQQSTGVQVSWASRAAGCVLSLSAPSRASHPIPDGASPAPTLASTSLPRHCTGNASRFATRPRFGIVGIIHNARRARHATPASAARLVLCLPITNTRLERDIAYITPPTPPRPPPVPPCTPLYP